MPASPRIGAGTLLGLALSSDLVEQCRRVHGASWGRFRMVVGASLRRGQPPADREDSLSTAGGSSDPTDRCRRACAPAAAADGCRPPARRRTVFGERSLGGRPRTVSDAMAGSATLLGRDPELAQAEGAVRAALTGAPAGLVISGDAGIGKSTLTRAVADRARQLGFAVGVGLCLDISSHPSQGPVHEALRQLGAGTDGADVAELVHALARRADRGPVLVVVEDLHWAEAGTRDAVRTRAH